MTIAPPPFIRLVRHHVLRGVCVIAGLVALVGRLDAAQSVELTWTPSPGANVVGYKVYFGTQSRSYQNSVVFGTVSDVIIPGLASGMTYYFGVTAFDTNGEESVFCANEAVYTVPTSGSIGLQVQASTQALQAAQVSWTASSESGVYGYAVNYWTQGSGYTNSTQFYGATNGLVTGLSAGTTYFFSVSVIDSYGVEPPVSGVVAFTVPNPAPIALNAQAPVATSGVELTWNDIQDSSVIGYYIYYGTASGSYSSSQFCGDVGDFIVHGLNSGQTYYFVVAPVDAYGDIGEYSQEASCVAAAPIPIELQVQGTTQALEAVDVSWTASIDPDVYAYSVNYWAQGSGYTNFAVFSGTTDGIISGLGGGTNYYFSIAPIDTFGIETVASGVVSYMVPALQPIVLQAQLPVGTSGVELTWNDPQNEGIASYNIYYGTQTQNYSQSMNCSDVNDFIVHGLNPGQTYYFVVAPVDGYGNQGKFSNEASSPASAPVPVQMQVQGTTTALEAVNVSWTASTDSDVDGYAVDYWIQGSGYTNSVDTYGATNAIISGLGGGTNYYFAIAPIDPIGVEAIASSEASYTVPIPKAMVLHGQAMTNTPGVKLAWNSIPNEGITSYNVYYGTQSGSYGYSQGYDSSVTNAVIQGLNGGQIYYFAVNAVDQYGNQSPFSNEVSAKTAQPARMVLQVQTYLDGNGQPYAMQIGTPSTVYGSWEVDSSPDLQNWTPYAYGSGSGNGDGYDVNVYVPIDPTQPPMFFRAINY
jgi:fibronectin type 3 domain-containing protein